VTYRDITKHALRIDEGTRNRPYKDTVGKLTIGVGRNLDDVGVNDDEIELMLSNDLDEAERTCKRLIPNFYELDDVRRAVVMNMAFNLGYVRYSKFKNTIASIAAGDWESAAKGMENSKWAKQVQESRSRRLIYQMRKGKL
jgi:lysozyme